MLLEFKITNFRSIKEEQVLSFLPSSRVIKRNTPTIASKNYRNLKLLRVCVIYGPNNAGKSNILNAFRALKYLVENSHSFNLDDPLEPNEAFHFDVDTKEQATTFEIDFIAKDQLRYNYSVSFNKRRILIESLSYFPNPDADRLKATKLFSREFNKFSFGQHFSGTKRKIEEGLLDNQLFLSKAVQNKVEQLNPVFQFFRKHIGLSIFHDTDYEDIQLRSLGAFIYNNEEKLITDLIEKFIINSDTGIIGIEAAQEDQIPQINFPDNFPKEEREKLTQEFVKRFQYQIFTQHRLYKNGEEVGIDRLPLKEQSTGTKKFFTMLRLVLVALRDGDVLIVDELDKSLHTQWTQVLISLFNNPDTNPNKAQLIFATHDTNLISNNLFSRDQIYLVEKNRFGASELFPLSSYSGLRKDTPLEKWYLSGRFGGTPKVYKEFLNAQLKKSLIFND